MTRPWMAWICASTLLLSMLLASSVAARWQDTPQPEPPAMGPHVVDRYWVLDVRTGEWRPLQRPRPEARYVQGRASAASQRDVPISTAYGWQMEPAVAYNPDRSECLVVWEDARNGTDLDIYGQRLDAQGCPLGSNLAIVIGEYDQWAPLLFYDSSEQGYLLFWHHRQPDNYALYGQRLSPQGALQGAPFRVEADGLSQPWIAGVTYNVMRAEYLVTWEDTSSAAIFGQRITSKGVRVGDVIVVSTQPHSQWTPTLVAFNSVWSEYLVVWDDLENGGLYGQIVTADGELRGESLPIALANGLQLASAVIYNSARDQYLVAWDDEHDPGGSGNDVYARWIGAVGLPLGDPFAISGAPGVQQSCVGAYDGGHEEYLLVWSDQRAPDTAGDIDMQRVSVDGSLLGPNIELSVSPNDQVHPALAYQAASDRYIVVWQEWQFTEGQPENADIYGMLYAPQRFVVWLPQVSPVMPGP